VIAVRSPLLRRMACCGFLRAEGQSRAEPLQPDTAPSASCAGLCHQRAGTFGCCWRFERANHFVDGVVEYVPAAGVLLGAVPNPTKSTLLGNAPAEVTGAVRSVPPTSITPFPGDPARLSGPFYGFGRLSFASAHGVESRPIDPREGPPEVSRLVAVEQQACSPSCQAFYPAF
jgi:hypothetical protein